MFARGARFELTKVSDVPAPNAYTIPQDSALDNYKRGAFLEKVDRFKVESAPETRKASPTQAPAERYVALQNRVDELEKVHLEGKKLHQVELEKIKQELAASQKQAAETADKLEKQKKQKATLEAIIQELKKTSLSDQGEIRELRHKLRLLEIERDKATSKQPELNELKKSHQALEIKRKDDIRERDRRVAELEKNLQAEKKKRELLESKNQESRRLIEEEAQNVRSVLQEKEGLLQAAREESQLAKEKLRQTELNNAHEEDELLEKLEHYRSLLGTVAQQYGALASHSASLVEYNQLKQDHLTLKYRQYRLERKLANSEGQVVELAHLIRQVKENNVLLAQQLDDALEDIQSLSFLVSSKANNWQEQTGASLELAAIGKDLVAEYMQLSDVSRETDALLSTYYHLRADQLYFVSTVLVKEHTDALALAEQRQVDLSSALASHEAIAARLEFSQKERMADQEALHSARADVDRLRSSSSVLEVQLADVRQQLGDLDAVHGAALKKEKDTVQRLTSAIQKSRMAEEALRTDIDRLTADLANAEAYQEAYAKLYDQVGLLIARNQLAEEEAERISKFNAEILGHQNPAQRILYVDRIRTELAEAKLKIAELAREQENLATQNDDLEHELYMYKSIRVDSKPRTNVTRVARPPLVNLTHSLNNSEHLNTQVKYTKPTLKVFETVSELSGTDMTLDEIMY